jgi:aspartate carbamoyltransferase catalytic subunit
MVEHRWSHKHLLSIADLSVADIETVLAKADTNFDEARKAPKKGDALRGRTVINVFFESSTRTRSSFEVAGKRLGADVVNISVSTSSVSKGETLLDTVKNLEVMRADAMVIRHQASGAPNFVANLSRASILNAGDGMHEHPTQALLDALTIRRHFGTLSGLTVAICGDIVHSRVARSNAILLGKTGSKVRLCGPKTMMPRQAEELGSSATVHSSLEDAIDGADVVMMLRIQNERLYGPVMASTREYSRTFGLNAKRLEGAKPNAIVMHPGPINRGVELDTRLADGARSVVLEQVEAGVAVRMAALDLCIRANTELVGA